MQAALNQRTLNEDARPSFCAGRKLGDVDQALLWSLLQADPQCPSRVLLAKVAEQHLTIAVSIRHVNRWRATWHLNGRKGRPRQAKGYRPVASGAEVVQLTPRVSCVGVHVLAPLFGLERLSGFDTPEHPLETLLGRGDHSSPLSQFLGQLERVDAGPWLLPLLLACPQGQITYIDGHMVAYWSRVAMHKGRITLLGRIMSGSQAVIAHDETGQAVCVAYYPPAIDLSQLMVAYCCKVASATETSVCVIDRAVNAVAIARAFAEQGLAGFVCLTTTNMRAWRALRPPRWRPWRMARGSRAESGKKPGPMIPATV